MRPYTFILSLVASAKSIGVEIKSGDFIRAARRSGLFPDAEEVQRSGLTKARKKVSWTIFRDILEKAVNLAYSLHPRNADHVWHGMSVIAFDDSQYHPLATQEVRDESDLPKTVSSMKEDAITPQCLVPAAYDVFRRLPVARSVVGIRGSEREEALALLFFVSPRCVQKQPCTEGLSGSFFREAEPVRRKMPDIDGMLLFYIY